MVLLADEINKIIWICSHKCGISTISTLLMNIYGFNVSEGYYVDKLYELGYCDNYKEEYKKYLKVIIIRNIYDRFISGFLEELKKHCFYKNIKLTFIEYVQFLTPFNISNA